MKRVGMLLKETNLGMAQAFLTPKRVNKQIKNILFYIHFFTCGPKQDLDD